jgi:hypothetical protein
MLQPAEQASLHFIPRNELCCSVIERSEPLFDFPAPYQLRIVINFRVQAIQQRIRERRARLSGQLESFVQNLGCIARHADSLLP